MIYNTLKISQFFPQRTINNDLEIAILAILMCKNMYLNICLKIWCIFCLKKWSGQFERKARKQNGTYSYPMLEFIRRKKLSLISDTVLRNSCYPIHLTQMQPSCMWGVQNQSLWFTQYKINYALCFWLDTDTNLFICERLFLFHHLLLNVQFHYVDVHTKIFRHMQQ